MLLKILQSLFNCFLLLLSQGVGKNGFRLIIFQFSMILGKIHKIQFCRIGFNLKPFCSLSTIHSQFLQVRMKIFIRKISIGFCHITSSHCPAYFRRKPRCMSLFLYPCFYIPLCEANFCPAFMRILFRQCIGITLRGNFFHCL